jgi:hypothetical protein
VRSYRWHRGRRRQPFQGCLPKKPKVGGKQEKYAENTITSPKFDVDKNPPGKSRGDYTLTYTLTSEGGSFQIICRHTKPPSNDEQISAAGAGVPVMLDHVEQTKVIEGLEKALRDGGVIP